MSVKGIKIAAEIFTKMQLARQELLNLGSKDATTKSGKQDMLLGQMLRTANDAVKEEFAELVDMVDYPELKPKQSLVSKE